MDFIINTFKIRTETAIFRVAGTVKGYKGDQTHFKPVDENPELENSGVEPWPDANWDDYYDEEPKRTDIDWPDSFKSTRAHAKIYGCVSVVSATIIK